MEILITGGAGFIGSNLAEFYLRRGEKVRIFDNFSRAGSEANIKWLKSLGGKLGVIEADIRNFDSVRPEVERADIVYHLAAQVAVTSSVTDPRTDFETNLLGSFNILEAARQSSTRPIIIFASTNKVYGEMNEVETVERETRYDYKNLDGVSEKQPLDFHSPYGCSKGGADQYVHDYSRIYGLDTIIFRQSCIYGPRQFGVEDQGWVAWFIIALTKKQNLTIYGDGKQVRDILYISDLVNAYNQAVENIKKTRGQIYNIGGGRKNTISIWYEFAPLLEKLFGRKIEAKFSDWRPGDQKVFITDISKAKNDFGWKPEVGAEEGIEKLFSWVQENKNLFQ